MTTEQELKKQIEKDIIKGCNRLVEMGLLEVNKKGEYRDSKRVRDLLKEGYNRNEIRKIISKEKAKEVLEK